MTMASIAPIVAEKALPPAPLAKLQVRDLNFYYGSFHALKHVSLEIPEKRVTAFSANGIETPRSEWVLP